MSTPLLMPKATAVWLVENTGLTFQQIADLCTLHPLEVKAIADGESQTTVKGLDPVSTGQISREEITRGEADPAYKLRILDPKVHVPESKRKGPRYTPVSRRHDRPNAVLWLLRYHSELKDAQISRLVGTTKPTIDAIRNRTHWNSSSLQPMDPVTLGLCSQIDLDMEVERAARGLPPAPETPSGSTLLSAAETTTAEALAAAARKRGGDDGELDADAVFAKLKSLKSTPQE